MVKKGNKIEEKKAKCRLVYRRIISIEFTRADLDEVSAAAAAHCLPRAATFTSFHGIREFNLSL